MMPHISAELIVPLNESGISTIFFTAVTPVADAICRRECDAAARTAVHTSARDTVRTLLHTVPYAHRRIR